MKHVWLVSRITTRDGYSDDLQVAMPTKAAAKQWVKTTAPDLVFSGDDGTGHFVARTNEWDWAARYSIDKVPFGGTS